MENPLSEALMTLSIPDIDEDGIYKLTQEQYDDYGSYFDFENSKWLYKAPISQQIDSYDFTYDSTTGLLVVTIPEEDNQYSYQSAYIREDSDGNLKFLNPPYIRVSGYGLFDASFQAEVGGQTYSLILYHDGTVAEDGTRYLNMSWVNNNGKITVTTLDEENNPRISYALYDGKGIYKYIGSITSCNSLPW